MPDLQNTLNKAAYYPAKPIGIVAALAVGNPWLIADSADMQANGALDQKLEACVSIHKPYKGAWDCTTLSRQILRR